MVKPTRAFLFVSLYRAILETRPKPSRQLAWGHRSTWHKDRCLSDTCANEAGRLSDNACRHLRTGRSRLRVENSSTLSYQNAARGTKQAIKIARGGRLSIWFKVHVALSRFGLWTMIIEIESSPITAATQMTTGSETVTRKSLLMNKTPKRSAHTFTSRRCVLGALELLIVSR